MNEVNQSKLCLVLRIPPPYGGGEIVSKLLYDGLKSEYDFFLIRRSDHSKSKQQNISILSYFYGIKYVISIIKHIKHTKPNSIFIGLPKTFPAFFRNALIMYYCTTKKINIYAELHGMGFPFLKKKLYRLFFLFIINKIKKIRVLSNSIKNYLEDLGYKNGIAVIDNSIEDLGEFVNSKPKTDKTNILYLGLISENKGFSRVIDIVESCLMADIDVVINVIGEWHSETYKTSMIQKIYDRNLSRYFKFHGALYDNSKWNEINNNQLIIHLSSFDGQPLSLIECMSIGIPAIATKVGAIPELIDNGVNGFLVDSNEEVLNVLKNINENKIDLNLYRLRCRKTYLERFHKDIFYKRMRIFLNS